MPKFIYYLRKIPPKRIECNNPYIYVVGKNNLYFFWEGAEQIGAMGSPAYNCEYPSPHSPSPKPDP